MGELIGTITTNVVLGYEYWEIRVQLLCVYIGNLAKLGVSGLAKLRKLSGIDGYTFFGVERAVESVMRIAQSFIQLRGKAK